MYSPAELIKEISSTIGKTKVVKLTAILKQQQFLLTDLIDITFHTDHNIAFRASWILENLFLQKPECYIDDLGYLLSRIIDVKNESCKRHYAKIVMHITAAKAPVSIKQKLDVINLEPVVEHLFDWMIDPKVRIAIKSFAAEALFNLRNRYLWVAEELANQIQFLMRNGSPAIQSKGKKLLAQLQPQK